MARNSTIAVSNEEKEKLDNIRDNIFGTDEVPYGVVINHLIESYSDDG